MPAKWNAWLEKLKVGDRVVVNRGHFSSLGPIHEVTAITKTMIRVDGLKITFRVKDGYVRGPSGGFPRPHLVELTPEVEAQIRKVNVIDYLTSRHPEHYEKFAPDVLEKIYTLVKEGAKEASDG